MVLQFKVNTSIICLLILFSLTGCGGGGGGDTTNIAPVADAGAGRVVTPGSEVLLDGSSSNDSDGRIISYQWVQTLGTTPVSLIDANTATPRFTAPDNGTRDELEFQLTVQDNAGAHSLDTVPIMVNINPVADAGPDQMIAIPSTETRLITLTGTSSDTDGTIASEQWVQTAGAAVALTGAATATATFTVAATTKSYSFSYTVTDNDGAQHTDTISINIIENNGPTADAGPDQMVSLFGTETSLITLTGASGDTDGTIVSEQWVQTAGSTVALTGATTATATFTVTATTEIYSFSYTVTDDDGSQQTDTVSVHVAENNRPVANAGLDQMVAIPSAETRLITLTGTASDTDGTISSEQWVQTAGATVTLTGATTTTATFTAPAITESYSFSYTVTDDDGAQQTDTVSVHVAIIIFSDSFTDDANWSYFDDTGNGDDWSVVNGQLHQNNHVSLATRTALHNDTSYHVGTYARLNALSGYSNYRFSVDITPLINDDDREGNDVGIMFRREDDYNYYRVSMNARYGFTRFEKIKNGNFQTVAVNAIGYIDNQDINMTVDVNDDTIVVWIDGRQIFAVVDPDTPSGTATVGLYCQDKARFDNVLVTQNPLQPVVAISTPLAYSIALTGDDGDTLSVEAVALNVPSGGSVGFILDDGSETATTASGNVYSTAFTGVADGEHEIMAVLKDANGSELDSDINSTVGTGGDYYLAIGDSITNGVGDTDMSNNDSTDGRIVSIQGFQAKLADDLTTTTNLPQIVYNEGLGGDKAADLANRIDSILERHPGANKVLLLIGTNDATGDVLPNAFETSVAEIAGSIVADGKDAWLAELLPTNGNTPLNTTWNALIEQYNIKIDGIATAYPDDHIFLGPDLYVTFDNEPALYFDNLHPNDAGYGAMADEWHDVLIP